MKKVFKMVDLDCANCAAKMERLISKINGVQSVSVNYIAQKMTVEADESVFEEIMENVVKCCKKVEPDCVIVR